ncbi:uncharacterized protein BJ171DRAFT_31726 [Polychytrium aggregatum]|uniref:uncharacterized protein n=1 Tax=Polychytrium aggregatum TaxID=110093 RepID=UPI0022FF113D|nr:uncharacterized protein BJ171DRAFT_31726 [Polychytrium aggregatum]KAI9206501.1 hypothetical protein BJ171DRAFT_31726 [Polychytrium aggregatum]
MDSDPVLRPNPLHVVYFLSSILFGPLAASVLFSVVSLLIPKNATLTPTSSPTPDARSSSSLSKSARTVATSVASVLSSSPSPAAVRPSSSSSASVLATPSPSLAAAAASAASSPHIIARFSLHSWLLSVLWRFVFQLVQSVLVVLLLGLALRFLMSPQKEDWLGALRNQFGRYSAIMMRKLAASKRSSESKPDADVPPTSEAAPPPVPAKDSPESLESAGPIVSTPTSTSVFTSTTTTSSSSGNATTATLTTSPSPLASVPSTDAVDEASGSAQRVHPSAKKGTGAEVHILGTVRVLSHISRGSIDSDTSLETESGPSSSLKRGNSPPIPPAKGSSRATILGRSSPPPATLPPEINKLFAERTETFKAAPPPRSTSLVTPIVLGRPGNEIVEPAASKHESSQLPTSIVPQSVQSILDSMMEDRYSIISDASSTLDTSIVDSVVLSYGTVTLNEPKADRSTSPSNKPPLPDLGPSVLSADLWTTESSAISLNLSFRNIQNLPTLLQPLNNLTVLQLNCNRLTEVHPSIFQSIPRLRVLDLSQNQIQRLPTEIRLRSESLEELYLGSNLLETVPLELGALSKLQVLDLSENRLTHLHIRLFTHMVNLQTLWLSRNRLQFLPPSLGVLRSNLQLLYIEGNLFDPSLSRLTEPLIKSMTITSSMHYRKTIEEEVMDSVNMTDGAPTLDDDISAELPRFHLTRTLSLDRQSSRSVNTVSSSEGESVGPSGSKRSSFRSDVSMSFGDSQRTQSSNRSLDVTHLQRLLVFLLDLHDLDSRIKLRDDRAPSLSSIETTRSTISELFPNMRHTRSDSSNFSSNFSSSQSTLNNFSDTESIATITVLKHKDKPERRAQIVAEICSTERTYVQQLQSLMKVYVKPLESMINHENEVLSRDEFVTVFSNIQMIQLFHQGTLLPQLEARLGENPQCLGAAFLLVAPYFKMYSDYYNKFDGANSFIVQVDTIAAEKSKPFYPNSLSNRDSSSSTVSMRRVAKKFKAFMSQAKLDPEHTQISLQSYLILPVQRLPRYKLLLDQLLEYTPPDHPDHVDLLKATEEMKQRVYECNENKRKAEELSKGFQIIHNVIRKLDCSAGGEYINANHRLLRETTFKVLKVVELKGSLSKASRVDVLWSVGGKKDKIISDHSSPLFEMRYLGKKVYSDRFIGYNDKAQKEIEAGGATAVYGVCRTAGKDFKWFLFHDLICWCKPAEESSSTRADLVIAIELKPEKTRIEFLEVNDDVFRANPSEYEAQLRPRLGSDREAIMRVSDGDVVIYCRGALSEIKAWVEYANGLKNQ